MRLAFSFWYLINILPLYNWRPVGRCWCPICHIETSDAVFSVPWSLGKTWSNLNLLFAAFFSGVSLLWQFSCVNPFLAARWIQHTDNSVRQLHHCNPTSLLYLFCLKQLKFKVLCWASSNVSSAEYHIILQGFMVCLQQVACIFSIVAAIVGSEELSEASQILNCMSDLVYWT